MSVDVFEGDSIDTDVCAPNRRAFDRICRLLESHTALDVAAIAEDCQVKPAAVRKLLPRLRDRYEERLRIENAARTSNGGRGYVLTLDPPPNSVEAMRSARSRTLLLALLREMMPMLEETSLRDTLDDELSAARRAAGLPDADLQRKVWVQASALRVGAIDPNVLDGVLVALWESLELDIRYEDNRGETFDARIAPLTIMLTNAGLHVYGECLDGPGSWLKRRRTWALSRVGSARPTAVTTAYPSAASFDPRTELEPAFTHFARREGEPDITEVAVTFDVGLRSYLTHAVLHASKRLEDVVHAGSPALRVHLRVFPFFDLVHWIRGYGKAVLSVEPSWLDDWVKSGEGLEGIRRAPPAANGKTSSGRQ